MKSTCEVPDYVARKVQSVMGNAGYRRQLDRTRRFLARFDSAQDDVEFQDMVWAFFQNCWHVKDWIKNDPFVPEPAKKTVIDTVHNSETLEICQALCNGTKHLEKQTAANHDHIDTTIIPGGHKIMDCMIDVGGGKLVSGRTLAYSCIGEWVTILAASGLTAVRLG